MKRTTYTILTMIVVLACGSKTEENKASQTTDNTAAEAVDDWRTNKGIGPISNVVLADEIDMELVTEGEEIFSLKCSACHKIDKRYIGPSPKGILDNRTPEWIMNMILNPDGMVKEDPIAKQLLIEYNGTPMANQNLTEEEARAILEYFRTL